MCSIIILLLKYWSILQPLLFTFKMIKKKKKNSLLTDSPFFSLCEQTNNFFLGHKLRSSTMEQTKGFHSSSDPTRLKIPKLGKTAEGHRKYHIVAAKAWTRFHWISKLPQLLILRNSKDFLNHLVKFYYSPSCQLCQFVGAMLSFCFNWHLNAYWMYYGQSGFNFDLNTSVVQHPTLT